MGHAENRALEEVARLALATVQEGGAQSTATMQRSTGKIDYPVLVV